ncbi:general L-amino acid transport system permease protein [Azospirillum agricola]|uniref:amino acid ABC transporter permease n=1 Tax=Azospirillum agricola TaxID=1720247 RepID=UPI001AEA9646|nr:ABC transporter permease subunit [Azospirillum agricola]MBP2230130.1 general L-amino acid transport system permease protein [Azospirillum agricola]
MAKTLAGTAASWWGGRSGVQLALLGAVLLATVWLGSNTVASMERFGITPGFDFLHRPAGFEIGESVVAYAPQDSYGRALLVGLLNTVKVAAVGCVLATLLGVALGVARLSGNPLLSVLAQGYVELIRSTPLLLQLFFWSATFQALPGPRQALNPLPGIFLCNRGILLPAFAGEGTGGWVLAALALAGLLAVAGTALRRRADPGGGTLSAVAVAAVALGVPAGLLAGVLANSGLPLAVEFPELAGFNFAGGATVSPEFSAMLVGLVVNATAMISEIVRGGIQAVPSGQWEAARALGLTRGRIMRLVVLPQALRVIVPLMTSSHLNLIKNSSLAVAIGFPDLVSVINTSANQTGQVLETMAIMMGAYLTVNLAVSAAMNLYNQQLERRGRR